MEDPSETKVSFSSVLEFVADNDVEGFKEYIELNPGAVDEVSLWYGRRVSGKGMVLEYRTPLMVAAMYGSLDVMKVIVSLSKASVNSCFGADKSTALHCAASGGSVDAVKLLIVNGADVNVCDAKGRRPFDVINVAPNQRECRVKLEEMLCYDDHSDEQKDLRVLANGLKLTPLTIPNHSEGKPSDLETIDTNDNDNDTDTNGPAVSEKKEYPFDPSLPDIKNSVYSTDEFRMYSFKVRPCSRAYSHDWTECPFVHPGENARRRDPRKYHYSCVPCPEFRKGSCRRGDMCEYAHGVFECWLHPAQYRTRLCKDGTSCNRRVCFFAHKPEELRPLYVSTGSAVPSPRAMASAAAVMDMAAALNMFPGSPSAPSAMSPNPPFTPPMSPSGNGMAHSSSGWQQQNIPTLHLPGSNIQGNNIQASRLRSSLNARDIHAAAAAAAAEDFMFNSPFGRSAANLDELFASEMLSPRYSDPLGGGGGSGTASMFSPSHKSAVMMNHFQMQQRMLSPINTKVFSPKSVDHHPLMQPPFGPSSSPGIMSPRGMDPQSPLNARLAALALRENHMRSLSARDLSSSLPRDLIPETGGMSGSPVGPWSMWDSSNGQPDWSANGDELNRLKRSNTMGHNSDEEPDLSWVQSLVKDPTSENQDSSSNHCGDFSNSN